MSKGSRGQRLHPSSPLFDVISSVRSLFLVLIGVVVAAGADRTELIIGLVVALAAALQALRYFLTWYRLDPSELVVSQGIVTRNERHIPYARIQNLDLVRGPLHRLFGVAEVRVQTASGSEPEATLRVLSMQAIERMREGISPGGGEQAGEDHDEGEQAETIVRLDLEDLVRLGLVANRSFVVIGAAIGIIFQFDVIDPIESWLSNFGPALDGLGLEFRAAVAIAGVAVFVVAMPVLSVAWSIVRFYGFRLERAGEDFRIRCGLFTEYASSVVRERVQLVSIRQSPMHRLFKRVGIRVETAGGVDEGDKMISRKWFVPIVEASKADAILGGVFPGVSLEGVEWRPLARGATKRMLVKSLVSWGIVAIGLAAWLKLWGVGAMLAILPLVIWHTVRTARFMGYARVGDAIMFRSGVWMRTTSVTLVDRVQAVSVGENPFDRRYGHASLSIDTAGAGPADHRIRIPYLETDRVAAMRPAISQRAESAA